MDDLKKLNIETPDKLPKATDNINEIQYENIKCQYVLKSGKNKDNKCNNNCKLGYNYCGKHKK